MNREIKFRAWNAKHSVPRLRMMYGVYLSPEGKVGHPDGEFYDLPLMQFTGLKDKNGKDIYEGDIVESGKMLSIISVVRWSTEYASWQMESPNGRVAQDIEHMTAKERREWDYEVIGNIYENAELINK